MRKEILFSQFLLQYLRIFIDMGFNVLGHCEAQSPCYLLWQAAEHPQFQQFCLDNFV